MTNATRLAPYILLAAVRVLAQIGGGSVIGYVTDPSKSPVSGARVAAIHIERNTINETRTNAQGYYEFPLLPAGTYRLQVVQEGFRPSLSEDFALNAGTRPRLDVSLSLQEVAESVQVVASAPLLNTTSTDLGIVVAGSKVESLPLNGRNFQQLVGLQAGVVNMPSNATGQRGGIEFNGSPALGNNLLLDGVDMSFGENNASASDTAAGAGTGSLINVISVEAIAEFKTTGSAFSAEYGRATGGVLNVTTKSGNNTFHGTLFEFFRNDKLDANNFFSNANGLIRPPLRWNQYGGNLGGPIRKDRLFYFFNYEGATVRRAQQVVGNVATSELLRRLPQAIRDTLETLPKSYIPTSNPLIGFSRRNDRQMNDEHTYLTRLDHNVGRHNIALRYNYNNQDYIDPVLQPNNPNQFPTRFHNAVFQDAFTISPKLFNEFRVGFNRTDLDRRNRGFNDLPPGFISVAGVGLNATLPSYIHFTTNTYSLVNNLTYVTTKHSFKTGVEVRNIRSSRGQGGYPTHTYANIDNLVEDRPNNIQLLFSHQKFFRTTNLGFYFQDDWRINSRLQLNLGLRYEYYTPLTGAYNIVDSNPFGPFNQSKDAPIFAPDRNNWGPRAGLVVDMLGNQKLVFRAGGGITYAPQQPFFYFALSFLDPRIPFLAQLLPADLPTGFPRGFPFPQALIEKISADPSLLPANLLLGRQIADHNRRDEYAGQWNASLQAEILPKLALQVSYVGSRGLKLYTTQTLNLPEPSTGRRPAPDIGEITYRINAAASSYHALQVSLNRSLSNGFSIDAFYTLGKTLSYGASDSTLVADTSIQDQHDFRGSYGPKVGEVRHRFVHIHAWRIPIGPIAKSKVAKALFGDWTVQGILSLASGQPINVVSGVDFIGHRRIAGQRPDFVGGAEPYVRNLDNQVWLNRLAFDNVTPARERRYGNLGFNALRGPGYAGYDAAAHKGFLFGERHRVTFRCELFNAFNAVNFNNPIASVVNPNFGTILSSQAARNVQLAVKYVF